MVRIEPKQRPGFQSKEKYGHAQCKGAAGQPCGQPVNGSAENRQVENHGQPGVAERSAQPSQEGRLDPEAQTDADDLGGVVEGKGELELLETVSAALKTHDQVVAVSGPPFEVGPKRKAPFSQPN